MLSWFVDSGLNFLPQLVSLLALWLAGVALFHRRRGFLVAASVLVVALGIGLAAYKSTLTAASGGSGAPLRVMTANLLFSNTDVAALSQALWERDPDVLVVQERSPVWSQLLERLLGTDYVLMAESSSGSTAIYRRARLEVCPTPEIDIALRPRSAVGCALVDGQPVLVLGVHAPKPNNPADEGQRAAAFRNYHAVIRAAGLPTVVAGDHNASPLSLSFRSYVDRSGLSLPTEAGPWFTPSWPNWLPAIGLRIDQILVTDELSARLVGVGPDIGSNHLPVIADVAILGRR
ncbi:endonuclease/exonuclease/phosphatase family protein [Amorphus sp. 3PC139-8]|uniref:endonuclease/exonuclease/phosphatase family protein n=1 Tax=Amorphus sp. 3PC139-8 TaxID=2735676 RepID=UPI00345C6DC0